MARPFIKGGTPIGSVSLCKTCTSAHIVTGYRDSEMITICTDVHPNLVLPFLVCECTAYYDMNRPSYTEMQKLAIDITPDPMKPVGFRLVSKGFLKVAKNVSEQEDDD